MDYTFPASDDFFQAADASDLFAGFDLNELQDLCNPADLTTVNTAADLTAVDSAVDLTSFTNGWASPSQLSPPAPSAHLQDFESIGAIHIPHSDDPPKVSVVPDKTKTRAETQIKVRLILDPVGDHSDFIHFPRKTLAKPKLLASAEERETIDSTGSAIHLDLMLVCATALDQPEGRETVLRRAAGKETVPRRPQGVAISELDKEDPAHPQNGGEVLICDGCKERERKRFERKKKRADDEEEWSRYEDDRIIMINEKEYKKWKDLDSGDKQFSPKAKQVEFAMRIACYCRHQEEKSPVGYKVIYTLKDASGNLLVQHVSEIFQITDDHKNREIAPEALPPPLSIPPQPYMHHFEPMPMAVTPFPYPVEGQYSPAGFGGFSHSISQPTTPAVPTMSSYGSMMPHSMASTPINLSRPASPTWEQGPQKRQFRCVYFLIDAE